MLEDLNKKEGKIYEMVIKSSDMVACIYEKKRMHQQSMKSFMVIPLCTYFYFEKIIQNEYIKFDLCI